MNNIRERDERKREDRKRERENINQKAMDNLFLQCLVRYVFKVQATKKLQMLYGV